MLVAWQGVVDVGACMLSQGVSLVAEVPSQVCTCLLLECASMHVRYE